MLTNILRRVFVTCSGVFRSVLGCSGTLNTSATHSKPTRGQGDSLTKKEPMMTYQNCKPAYIPYSIWCANEMWPRATVIVKPQDVPTVHTNPWVRVFRRNLNIPLRRWTPSWSWQGEDDKKYFYDIDLKRMTPDEKQRLIQHMAELMKIPEHYVSENIDAWGARIPAEQVIVSPPVRRLN